MDPLQTKHIYQVIIIGAGAAGIGAASILKKENVPFILLQARNRIGGRLLTQIIDGVPADLGASWIHSYSTANPMKQYVKKLKTNQAILPKKTKGRVFMDGQQGKQFDDDVMQTACCNQSYFFQMAYNKCNKLNCDLSLYEAGKQFFDNCASKFTPEQRRCFDLYVNLTQHYEGSSIKQLSTNNYQFREDEGGDFTPENGYGQFIKDIAANVQIMENILFERIVKKISYQPNKVFVQCQNGQKFLAKKIIASLPLGVLKQKMVQFDPPLPQPYQKSINSLGIGLMNKIIVAFQQNFWGSMSWISVGCDERGKFSQIYNLSQKHRHVLCCFITDNFARKMQNYTDQGILQQFLHLLNKIFAPKQIKIRGFRITRWGKQQFSLGSFASFHFGSSPEDCYQIRKPLNKTLWLVGQHCYAEHIGTAHGAFKTGIMSANQVLQQLKWVNPILLQPMHIKKDK